MNVIYKAIELTTWDTSRESGDGKWMPARPFSRYYLFQRIKAAFGVLLGKYDAVDWEQDK